MTSKVVECPKCHTALDATKAESGVKVRCRKCGTVFTVQEAPAQDPLVGKTLGGYEILEKLGEGGIGAVYKARQLSLSRLVAFKTLKPEFANNTSFVARLQREARSAAQISHPNIVQTIDVGSDKGVHFIAMELVEGQTLNDLIAKKGRLSMPDALNFLEQAARALDRAHEVGIIHRDIKPDNMIVDKDGAIKLMDFGLAKRPDVDVSVTQEGAIAGTPRYMSPEQGNGKPLDGRSDIYSLGATIYHALAGAPPFDGPTAVAVILKHVSDPLPPVRNCNPLVTPKMAAIIERMLAKKPEERFQTPKDLLDAVADARATLATDMAEVQAGLANAPPVMAPPPGTAAETKAPTPVATEKTPTPAPACHAPLPKRRRRVVVTLVLLALAAAVFGAVQVQRRRQAELLNQWNPRFEACSEHSREQTYDNRYKDAIAVLDEFLAQGPPTEFQQKAAEAKQVLLGEAEGRFNKLAADTEALVNEKKYNEARERYLEVAAKYGVPAITEKAANRALEIGKMMESQAAAMLEEIKEAGKGGRPTMGLRTKYNDLTRLYPGTTAAREADEFMEGLSKKMRGRQWKDVLTVSKDGKSAYTTIKDAVDNALNGSTIEIRDSAVYAEPEILSSRTGITLKGTKERPPTIVSAQGLWVGTPPGQPRRPGRFSFMDGLGVPAIFNVQSGWRFENLILDGAARTKGVLVYGSVTVESCAFLNMGGSAVFAFVKGSHGSSTEAGPSRVEVLNCVFLGVPKGAVVNLDATGSQETHLDFGNNLVCRAPHVFRRIGNLGGDSALVVHNNIFSGIDLLLYDPYTDRNKVWKFQKNCYASPGPRAYLFEFGAEPIVDLQSWQTVMGCDQDSVVGDPMFVGEESGNFALKPESPCVKAGIGPKNDTVLRFKLAHLAASPPAMEPGPLRTPPSPGVTTAPQKEKPKEAAEEAAQKARDSVKALLAKNQYAEALAVCESVKGDDAWKKERTDRIGRIVQLKKLIIDRINAQANVPVSPSLWSRKRDLTGGVFKSATEDVLTADMKGSEFKVRWDELMPEDVRQLAEKCADIKASPDQMAIGIFCIEQGLAPKAAPYLNYAKSTAKTPAEKEEAARLMAEVEKTLPPPAPKPAPKPATPAPTPPAPPKPKPATFQDVLKKIEDCTDERRLNEVVSLFKEAQSEFGNNPDFLYSFGIIVSQAVTNNPAVRGGPPRKMLPIVEAARFSLRKALSLAPKHPKAEQARFYLEKLQELSSEGKPERRP